MNRETSLTFRQAGLGPPVIPIAFSEQAEMALTVHLSEPLENCFRAFGLDPAKPLSWRLLLYIFAETHFGSRKPRSGAPVKWSDQRLCELLADFSQLRARHPKKSQEQLCDLLKKDPQFKPRYEEKRSDHPSKSAIRQRPEAQRAASSPG